MFMRWFLWLLLVLISIQPLRVGAHDHGYPELDAWFKSLTNVIGGSCCDGSDAYSVEPDSWARTENPEFPFVVMWEGQKLQVFKNNVVKATNKVGIAKIWPYRQTDEGGNQTGPWQIRCFMPGTES